MSSPSAQSARGVEFSKLVQLAVPLVLARVGASAMGMVDTMVAGRISPEAVAAVGLGSASWFMVFIIPFGISLGLDPLVSQAVGAGRPSVWKSGLVATRWLSLILALPAAILVFLLPDFMEMVGQPPEVVEVLRPYMAFMAVGMLPSLLFHTYATYLTAHGHTRQFVMITVVINLLNLALDVWFVHGGLGVPALGLGGVGAATMACAFTEYFLLRAVLSPAGTLAHLQVPWRRPDPESIRKVLRTGVPVGVQYGFEVAGFTVVTFLVGLFGAQALAGHQIALNLAGMTFTVALGVGAAGSVRVGQALGAGDPAGVRRAGWTAIAVGIVFAAGSALVIWYGREWIARLYSPDPETIRMGASFLAIAAAFQFADMAQAIGFGVLRGLDDTKVPVLFNVVGYWVLGVPLGALGAFYWSDDPRWLWWGLTGALSLVAVSLLTRFWLLTRQLEPSPRERPNPG